MVLINERIEEFNKDVYTLLKKYDLINENTVIYEGTIFFSNSDKFPEVNLTVSIK